MCGITGFLSPSGATGDRLRATAQAMADSLAHRGPDGDGIWTDAAAGVALGHRRLAILELSPLGAQPMASADGRFVIVFNGEVYNHQTLRPELEAAGYAFRGTSDTETMLAAIGRWGLVPALERFVGMFAFALWDRETRELHLVRDRMGIKPLYYGRAGRDFVFGSELKALRAHPDFAAEVDRDALCLYFRHNYVPAPHSICRGVRKLEPGCLLTLRPGESEPAVTRWWSARDVWERGDARPFAGTEDEALDELERLLGDAVAKRMLSDVPLGAFLSGGIDSSTVVALMQAASSRPVKTFSIGFGERAFDEAPYARAVAEHLGTDHTELILSPKDLLEVVPSIPEYWDEPFSDSSQIPTYCVSRLARRSVTVSLSGDGGDELFAGYGRYFWARKWRFVEPVPLPLRRLAALAGKALPEAAWRVLGPKGTRLRWRLDGLCSGDFQHFYRYLLSHFKDPAALVLGGREPETALSRPGPALSDRFRLMTLLDVETYLPDDILTKVDRASMAVSLEARVPILDHRVAAFAAALPTSMKVRDGRGKWLLRRLLRRYVPDALVERPKMGFGVPIERWLGHELRDWCESLLDEGRMREQGYLDAGAVRRIWRDYLAGQGNWYYYLWDVLMFQAWLDRWAA
ncbi:asparagine synthase (glutamine-hydrolyzing) [Pseudodesulfovibrio sp.]|uniref:asparagine synthase (glutamine-hydrolyzing) n=1 Tax=Pseudodesulfovibrio sp. TaxID=2035812 RepID=UPI00262D8FF2|nr:asparagine synthase (glutamine-hydrolyzing) [Pseudodesulfovibrio sp.]MDD3312791.1 asparagine synthase (glutamine-hydrolyzing) [Pseudodesulfovibrio sp.]